ncbi:MAG: biopolymer transporter ExbD [Planctomycetes bacterium]|nr:biopolymer transporter ExbD [Planctomycetota bacterium]
MRVPRFPHYLPGPDMTPMIDCVFLLMIFFMVSTDMGAGVATAVQLPDAAAASPEDEEELGHTLVVDVVDKPAPANAPGAASPPPILLDGRPVASLEELRVLLRRRSDPRRFPERSAGLVPGTTLYPSARRLRIRCDREQLWGWVSAVMELCTLRRGVPLEREIEESPLLRHIEIAVLQGAQAR